MWEITPEISASVHEYVRTNRYDLLWMFRGEKGLRVHTRPACSICYATEHAPADALLLPMWSDLRLDFDWHGWPQNLGSGFFHRGY